jgi:hypothetical protein
MRVENAVVTSVEQDGDRTLVYIDDDDHFYHIIASRNSKVKSGDCIKYEPYGVNFGWLIENEDS